MQGAESVDFSKWGPWPFLAGGLLDGLTPCATSTIVFLAGFLLFFPFKNKERNVFGGCFIAAVFITFCFMEMGAFEGSRRLELFFVVTKAAYIFASILSIVLGVLCLRNWWMAFRNPGVKEFPFQFSKILRKEEVSAGNPLKRAIWAVAAGFLAAILSSICRGQVYLSMMLYMLAQSQKIKAIFYILVYNLMAVLPLIFIFGLVHRLATRSSWQAYLNTRLSAVKVVTAAVLLALGCGLLFMFTL